MKKYFYILLATTIISCSSDESENPIDNFDRKTILISTYDNIIIPAYNDLNNKLNALQTSINSFINTPNEESLNVVRKNWVNSYISWQSVAMFNIRKAEEIFYADIMNVYPCNQTLINNKIADSTYQIEPISINTLGTTGFPAIGYLIYGLGSDSSNVLSYYTNADALKYNAYLSALISNMTYNTEIVLADWENNKSNFINSTGNTSTSSLNKIINDFLQYFEKRVREAKIATPSGVRGDLIPKPEQIESLFKPEISKELLQHAFTSIERFYYGNSYFGLELGAGLESYLKYLDNSEELRNAISNQIDDIKEKINLLDENFILQLENDPQAMWDVFYSMQLLVTYTKSDMLSKFNISSDYMDNDGD